MINLLFPRPNIIETTWLFVKSLNVKISYTTLKNEIEEHPFYPSLLSISEVLSNFGIQNITAKFEIHKIPDLPTPFLIQIKNKESDNNFFSVVRKTNKEVIEYYDPQSRKWKIEDRNAFILRCTGIALIAEATQNAGEKKYKDEILKEKKSLYFQYFAALILPLLVATQGIVGFVNNGNSALQPFAFAVLYLLGSVICLLLILNDIGHHSPAVQAICGSGKKVNCNAVLSSDGAKIFGVNWSIVGYTYFVGGLIYILILGFNHKGHLFILWQSNLIGTLYIFYSIYYQWRIAKNWCLLCLSVQLNLLLITIFGFLAGWHHYTGFSLSDIIGLLTSFIITFITSILLYSILVKIKDYRNGKLEFQRLKRNPDFLRKNLSEQKAITGKMDDLGITLGNPMARNKIVKVCNPYCNPCSLVHDSVKELLNNSNDLSIQIIFTATNDSHDTRAYPVRHFLALYENNKVDINDALNDWYHSSDKSYETFAAKYPVESSALSQQNEKIEAMRIWCDGMGISFTPTFFANGYQLPDTYNIMDLKYYVLD